ncbi:hypothetical protein [Pseudomonas amygdali]|uniref:Uncharacterized protein n=1 Tax=Pseudomonas amygdali pv. lachrymans str. M301315 TaxID=629260 RepID=A0AAD0V9N2_PSEAV|nr:hypothetical protein [Pseudomonas amygdali]AXH59918.1 hypothetical protein PLA107_032350 [Pseudomonas amygdali pv. lachrymans str. M301315]
MRALACLLSLSALLLANSAQADNIIRAGAPIYASSGGAAEPPFTPDPPEDGECGPEIGVWADWGSKPGEHTPWATSYIDVAKDSIGRIYDWEEVGEYQSSRRLTSYYYGGWGVMRGNKSGQDASRVYYELCRYRLQ